MSTIIYLTLIYTEVLPVNRTTPATLVLAALLALTGIEILRELFNPQVFASFTPQEYSSAETFGACVLVAVLLVASLGLVAMVSFPERFRKY